jgi:hypothetical protein
MQKIEQSGNKDLEEEVQEPSENRLTLHAGSRERLDQSIRDGLFMTSDEENDGEEEEVARGDRENHCSYFLEKL